MMAPPIGPPKKKKPSLTVAIGLKPKEMAPPGEDPPADPGGADDGGGDDPTGAGAAGAKHTEAEAHVLREDKHCKSCLNWSGADGSCAKVEGVFEPEDACVRYWEAGGTGEPDSDDTGGPPDNDADDTGTGMPMGMK